MDTLNILFFLLVFIPSFWYFIKHGKRNKPPGPWGLPFLGHLIFLGEDPHQQLIKWKSKYGPIVSVNFGAFPAVAISDYKIIREISNNPAFMGRPSIQSFLDRSWGRKRGILFSDGETWNEQRRFVVRHLKALCLEKKEMEINYISEAHELVEKLCNLKGRPQDTSTLFNVPVINSIWKLIANDRFANDDKKIQVLIEKISENIVENNGLAKMIFFFPWISRNFPSLSGYNKCNEVLGPIYDFIRNGPLKSHRETFKEGEPRDLIDAYIEEINRTENKHSSFYQTEGDLNLQITILDLFVAGNETVSKTLSWTLLYIALQESIQEKIHEQIDSVIGSRHVSLADKVSLPFVEACMMESLRMSCVAPIGIFKNTMEKVKLCGYEIEKDTMILTNFYASNFDEDYWGDPRVFRPERFLNEDGTRIIKHEAFQTFGFGKRNCIGEAFAINILFTFITSLYQRFKITLDPESLPISIQPVTSFTLSPQPHKICFTERI